MDENGWKCDINKLMEIDKNSILFYRSIDFLFSNESNTV